jgi:hypothetical protein
MGRKQSSSPSPSDKKMLSGRIDSELAHLLKINSAKKSKKVQDILNDIIRAYLKREGDLE